MASKDLAKFIKGLEEMEAKPDLILLDQVRQQIKKAREEGNEGRKYIFLALKDHLIQKTSSSS